jgi:hypothetical protein
MLVNLADREILERTSRAGAPASRRDLLGNRHHLTTPWAEIVEIGGY